MSKIKVLLIDNNDKYVDEIRQYFSSHVVIEVSDVAYNNDGFSILLKPSDQEVTYDNLELSITKLLHEFGIPSHIKGYSFIKEAIALIYNDPNLSITKDLYPMIANKYNTTVYSVERAIRHAIESSWNRANWEIMEEVFGYSIDNEKAKATNGEFIVTLADKLKL